MSNTIRWDNYQHVKEALANPDQIKLVVICFIEEWNKIALHAAQVFESIRMKESLSYAQFFILKLNEAKEIAYDLRVNTTPAVALYWEGKPFKIQRPGWDEDIKVVGTTSREKWLNVIRYARESGENGNYTLYFNI